MPISQIAKSTGLAWNTIKNRIDHLEKNGILREPYPILKYEVLELERHHVTVSLNNSTVLSVLEESLNDYPYIRYRARFHGDEGFGLYLQFDIPKGTEHHLESYLGLLLVKGVIDDYQRYVELGPRYETRLNFSQYNFENQQWKFSWKEWLDRMDEQEVQSLEYESPKSLLGKIEPIHFEVLQLLFEDARTSQKQISERLQIPMGQAHRHYRFVMEKLVKNVRLYYDTTYFDLTSTYMAIIKAEGMAEKVFNNYVKGGPPFSTSLSLLQNDKVLLWGSFSPQQGIDAIFSLWEKFSDVKVYLLDTTDRGSFSYDFYPPNFDFDKRWWKVDRYYMVEEPFLLLDQRMEGF